MSIITPEIGTTYGSLDSTAFTDGRPYGAHMLRTILRGRNRLVAKGHEAFNLVWPVSPLALTESFGVLPFEVVVPPFWAPLHPPIPVEKKPGLVELNTRMTANVLDSWRVQFQVASLAQPFREGGPYVTITADGDNDEDAYTIGTVPVSPGGFEEYRIFFRAVPDGTLVNTSTVGTPNTASSGLVINEGQVVLSTASWNAVPIFSGTPGNNLAENGTAVVFMNGNGVPVTYPRLVVDVISDRFTFAPLLTQSELADARIGQEIDLVQLPRITVANLMGYYSDREV